MLRMALEISGCEDLIMDSVQQVQAANQPENGRRGLVSKAWTTWGTSSLASPRLAAVMVQNFRKSAETPVASGRFVDRFCDHRGLRFSCNPLRGRAGHREMRDRFFV